MEGFRKHIENHITVSINLTKFAEAYRQQTAGESRKKVDYIGKRVAQMIGDQVTIFMSYPVGDKKNKARFMLFDEKIKKISQWIYSLSEKESGTLKILRRLNFRGYKAIMKNAKKRNGI